ncbi:MAG: ABC transporter ATP-binding protein [Candidatus Latescibacterota bacterium]
MLEAIDLTKRYEDGVLALDHLNLKIAPGELFALLGANGAGKTTTINLMLNFIEPTDGTATINDIDVTRRPLDAKQYVSYLPENVLLYGNLTARQNLDFFAKLGGKRRVTRDEYHMAMRRVGLPERAFEQRVRKFSKGMRQRLGIAIVLIKDAPVVIMDEPTSGLDPKGAADFCDLLRQLRDAGKALFISMHDVFRARDIADRVGIMKEGHLVMVRDREDLKYENLEEIYLNYMRAA